MAVNNSNRKNKCVYIWAFQGKESMNVKEKLSANVFKSQWNGGEQGCSRGKGSNGLSM